MLTLFKPRSEQQWRLNSWTWYFYPILYTNVKYGQKVQPLFWLKSQILFNWKGSFSAKLCQHKLVTYNYLLTTFEENLYKFLRIIKQTNR